jgi:hypothetical protein
MAVITRLERKSRRWEQVWQGDNEPAATIVAGRLEAEGIRTRVAGHSAPYRATAMNLGAAWGILVPAGRAAKAREVLRENDESHNIIEDDFGEGFTTTQRATLAYAALGAVAIVLAIIVLSVLGSN